MSKDLIVMIMLIVGTAYFVILMLGMILVSRYVKKVVEKEHEELEKMLKSQKEALKNVIINQNKIEKFNNRKGA